MPVSAPGLFGTVVLAAGGKGPRQSESASVWGLGFGFRAENKQGLGTSFKSQAERENERDGEPGD